MKMAKKLNAILLAMVMSITLIACNGPSTQPKAPESSVPVSSSTGSDETKVKVGPSWANDKENDPADYQNAVTKVGGEYVMLPQIKTEEEAKKALATVDALVMRGGEDIDPKYYNEKPDALLETVDPLRDTSDYLLIQTAIKEDIPALLTCRGMQIGNVVCGGTLYQDFPSQYKTDVKIIHRDQKTPRTDFVKHMVTVEGNNIIADAMGGAGEYEVNSWHHQAVKDVGKNLKVVAKAPDGIVEGYVKTDNTYFMGVQFHPEAMIAEGNNSFLPFYQNLIAQGAKEQNEKEAA